MSLALKNLLTLLNLEKIEEGLFRGQSEDLGLRQVFGSIGFYQNKSTGHQCCLISSEQSGFFPKQILKRNHFFVEASGCTNSNFLR